MQHDQQALTYMADPARRGVEWKERVSEVLNSLNLPVIGNVFGVRKQVLNWYASAEAQSAYGLVSLAVAADPKRTCHSVYYNPYGDECNSARPLTPKHWRFVCEGRTMPQQCIVKKRESFFVTETYVDTAPILIGMNMFDRQEYIKRLVSMDEFYADNDRYDSAETTDADYVFDAPDLTPKERRVQKTRETVVEQYEQPVQVFGPQHTTDVVLIAVGSYGPKELLCDSCYHYHDAPKAKTTWVA
jgi:hypothetical protein